MTASAPDDDATKTRVYTLLKLFDTLEYAESFRAGRLRMQPVSYFREYKDANGAMRGDSHEGISGLMQPSQLGSIKIGTHEIPASELAAPLLLHPEKHQSFCVLCFYALTNAGLEKQTFETLQEMKDAVQVSKECLALGSHLVYFTRPEEFLKRVHAAFQRERLRYSRRLVQYYDPETFHGFFPEETVPFQKRSMFAHQREYRIAAHTDEHQPTPFVLEVGDLSDITELIASADFNGILAIEPKNKTDGPASEPP